jgi:diguanylate cyclase (GGDEF)-like protein/PAS domain S-box-containing protein
MAPDFHPRSTDSLASSADVEQVLCIFDKLRDECGRVCEERLLGNLSPQILQDVEILAPLPDGDWRYISFGPGLVASNGHDMSGRCVGDLPREIREEYRAALIRLSDEGRPVLAPGKVFPPPSPSFWERLLLPCRDAEGRDLVVSFVKPNGTREELLSAVFHASQDGIAAVRAVRDENGNIIDGRIVTANDKACEYAGYSRETMVGGSVRHLFSGLIAGRIWRRCLRTIRGRTTERFELNISHHQLDTWLGVTLVALGDGFVVSFNDVTDLKQALLAEQSSRAQLAAEVEHRRALEAELRHLSHTDDLTGVANRRAFNRALRKEIVKSQRYGGVFSIIAIDIDHFKKINDRFGHAGGDEVLMAVAAIFNDALRRNVDLVARVGGEEFMLLLPQTDESGAIDLAERLRRHLADMPVSIGGEPVSITASFGVKQFDGRSDPERLTIEADDALYKAKRGGRNCVVACSVW